MKKSLIMIVAMLACLSGCARNEESKPAVKGTPQPSNKLTIMGSTTLFPVVEKGTEAFKKRQPDVNVSLAAGGSLAGINGFKDGYADIAMSSRELTGEERTVLKRKNIVAKETVVAWDGIVPIVHPSNPVKDLTIAQLKDIYIGKITNWKALGGKPEAIKVVARDFSSGTHEAWAHLVLNNEAVVSTAEEKLTSQAILETIAREPTSIGYDGIGYVQGNNKVKIVSVDGQMASADSILNKKYKIGRPLYLIARETPTTAVVGFLEFMTSADGQAIVKETKFVPVPHE